MNTQLKQILGLTLSGALVMACGGSGGQRVALPGQQSDGGQTTGNDQFQPTDGDDPAEPDPVNPLDGLGPPEQVECDNEGATQICFDGNEALVDKGECKAGVRTCNAGYWTPCVGQVIPVPEYCDFRDNDCDGDIDEGVLSKCGDCNPYCTQESVGAGTAEPLVPEEQNSLNVVTTNDGWLTLTEKSVNLNVIWIANSAEATVSKLDTTTGNEMGRYQVCSDPSRTAVSKFGDGWVACRSDQASVAYIYNFEGECEDKNGNGTIETSRDLNNDKVIDKNTEMLPFGTDECVKWVQKTSGVPGNSSSATRARALGVDQGSHAWVGLWESKQLVRLEPQTGTITQSVSIPAQPYGLTIDQQGIVWVSGRGGGVLVRMDPNTNQVQSFTPGGGYSPYGIAVDEFGRIWTPQLGGSDAVWMFDPKTNGWKSIAIPPRGRGVVANGDGRLFVACDSSNRIAVIDLLTLTKINEINLGGGQFPIGMAVDSAGFIWAVNQQSGSVHKINGQSLGIIGNYPVGKGPYTYSDMTGSAFFDAVPPGWYRHRFEASKLGGVTGLAAMSNAIWGALSIDYVAPPGSSLKFRVRTGTTEEDLAAAQWTPLVGPFPPQTFPVDLSTVIEKTGHFLEVEVWMYPSEEGAKPLVKGFDLEYEAAP